MAEHAAHNTYNSDVFFFFLDADSSTASFVSRLLDFLPSLSFEPNIASFTPVRLSLNSKNCCVFAW